MKELQRKSIYNKLKDEHEKKILDRKNNEMIMKEKIDKENEALKELENLQKQDIKNALKNKIHKGQDEREKFEKEELEKYRLERENLEKKILQQNSEKNKIIHEQVTTFIDSNKINLIRNVYQNSYVNNTKASGFGDFLRGCYFLMNFCNNYNIKYEIFINHPITRFLKYSSTYSTRCDLRLPHVTWLESGDVSHRIPNNISCAELKESSLESGDEVARHQGWTPEMRVEGVPSQMSPYLLHQVESDINLETKINEYIKKSVNLFNNANKMKGDRVGLTSSDYKSAQETKSHLAESQKNADNPDTRVQLSDVQFVSPSTNCLSHLVEIKYDLINNIVFFNNNNFTQNINKITNVIEYSQQYQILPYFLKYLKESTIIDGAINIYTIAYPNYNILESHKLYMRTLLEPSDELNIYINNTLKSIELKKQKYSVIHIRCGDDYLIKKYSIENKFLNIIINTLLKIIKFDENYLLISDSIQIKQLLVKQFPFLKTIYNPIAHFGEGVNQQNENIKNTLLDFYLMSYSKNINSYSVYQHGSGFSKWCAETYNIPYICKFIR